MPRTRNAGLCRRPACCTACACRRPRRRGSMPGGASEQLSPWAAVDGWRLNLEPAPQQLLFRCGGEELAIEATAAADGWTLRLDDRRCRATAAPAEGRLVVTLDGTARQPIVLQHG